MVIGYMITVILVFLFLGRKHPEEGHMFFFTLFSMSLVWPLVGVVMFIGYKRGNNKI